MIHSLCDPSVRFILPAFVVVLKMIDEFWYMQPIFIYIKVVFGVFQ